MSRFTPAATRILAALLLSLVAAASFGGRDPVSLPDPRGGSGEAATLQALLKVAAATPGRQAEVARLATDLLAAARREGLPAEAALTEVFPPSDAILAMLALDRDVDDFEEAGEGSGKAAAHYRHAAAEALAFRALRPNFGTLFATAWAFGQKGRPEAGSGKGPSTSPAVLDLGNLGPRSSLVAPNLADLAYSHPFALDIFYRKVGRVGEVEFGPRVSALEDGIVVAAAGDWQGGAGQAAWRGGGLSPSAGNGVIVYAPGSRRYYSYFHFSEVAVRTGQVVRAGQELGRGGNSGANARKAGHGGHLHLEIFDEATGRAYTGYRIYALLFGHGE